MRTILFLALSIGCTPAEFDPDPLPERDLGEAPEAILELPELAPGPIEILGEASDPDQPPNTLILHLDSDIDGLLWRGNTDADGFFEWSGALTEGTHQITLEVIDRTNQRTLVDGSVVVGEPTGG